jgi:hypothetical protein
MTSCLHKMCGRTYGQTNMKRAMTLAKINHLWNRYNMHMLRSWPTKIPNMNQIQQDKWLVTYTRFRVQLPHNEELIDLGDNYYTPTRRVVGILEYPCPSVRPSLNLVYVTSHLSFVGFYSDGWFLRVIALFMFVWPYVRQHILCTQLVICLLSHFIHIWYLGWPTLWVRV